jgi:alpha-tubulin suppressor-like RCC1 family protein
MAKKPTNFQFNNGGSQADFADAFVYMDLFSDGGLWTWGANNDGQLGDGSSVVHRSSPIQTIAGGTNWKSVGSVFNHTPVIKTDGTLWLWGSNTWGQLGDNSQTSRSSPVQTVSVGTNWKQVAGGLYHTAAIKTDGTLWTWGLTTWGQLGDNTNVHRSSPVQTVAGGTNWKQVTGGYLHTAAIKTDGTLWTWGRNTNGQLGDDSITHRSSPIQTVSGGTNWKLVACGAYYTAAIKTDGTLWTWGNNNGGKLGDNTQTHRSSPVQTVAGGTNWKLVGCGRYHAAAIKTDGTLWLWGNNNYGQLGTNTRTNRTSPVQTVAGGTNWKLVAGGRYHTAAIKTDGTLWTWGLSRRGDLGDNTTTHRSSPVQTVSGGTNWKLVSTGDYHTAAISSIT